MADEPRYSDEIRIPITVTLPWSGRLTPNGDFWPIDIKGREWPSNNRGEPEFPIDLLPVGFAPGTSHIYQNGDGRRVPEQFAAMDRAMFAEAARARRATGAIQQVADPEPSDPGIHQPAASQADAPEPTAKLPEADQPALTDPAAEPTPASPTSAIAAEPEHGSVWTWLHRHGLAETRHEQADDLRRFIKASGGLLSAEGEPVDVDAMSDDDLLALDRDKRQPVMPFFPGVAKPPSTPWGHKGTRAYRQALEELRQPGTHETLNGRVPTQQEAEDMIAEIDGIVDRIEDGHPPPSKSSHDKPHINYRTEPNQREKREKATVYIQKLIKPK